MRIVVTGSAGYIGSDFVTHLRDQYRARFQVLEIDLASNGEDVSSVETRNKIEDFKPQIIFNFAGISGEKACRERPHEAFLTDCLAPWRLAGLGVPLLVQASTLSILDKGDSRYARYKGSAEVHLETAGVPVLCLRFGTLLGSSAAGPEHMRWDLPVHKMVLDAVTQGVITIPREPLMRPWLLLGHLRRVLVGVALDAERSIVPAGFTLQPLVSFNASLEQVARRVARRVQLKTGKPVTIDYAVGHKDLRSYASPAVCGTTPGHCSQCELESVVEDCITLYRTGTLAD